LAGEARVKATRGGSSRRLAREARHKSASLVSTETTARCEQILARPPVAPNGHVAASGLAAHERGYAASRSNRFSKPENVTRASEKMAQPVTE
jgi:hypothetical protein